MSPRAWGGVCPARVRHCRVTQAQASADALKRLPKVERKPIGSTDGGAIATTAIGDPAHNHLLAGHACAGDWSSTWGASGVAMEECRFCPWQTDKILRHF
jgi:hypothetical protein